jgi:hypothetical protein
LPARQSGAADTDERRQEILGWYDAVVGRQVCIELTVRRLFCNAPRCRRVTFAEQVDRAGRAPRRRIPQLGSLLGAIAVALAGRAGERALALLAKEAR